MASCVPPAPRYQPNLRASIVDQLSDAQLETVIYAGESHSLDLPGLYRVTEDGNELIADADAGKPYRMGYFLADGTGAGKGRQVAGVILDNWLAGRQRAVWISKSEPLIEDARRDWTALGGLESDIRPMNDWTLGSPITLDRGILFCTYATLRSSSDGKISRLHQLLAWLGEDYDGVIAFDEAHEMQNAVPGKSDRGDTAPSQQGLAGYRLQNLLPRARILYVSATGATKPEALGYAARLGLWGEGAGFTDRMSFLSGIAVSGLAGMEVIVRDLKTLGRYCARALSFAGVEYDLLEHRLTSDQVAAYNRYAAFWALISQRLTETLQNLNIADPIKGGSLNGQAMSAARSRFESVKLRFFDALLNSMKLPTLMRAIEGTLDEGGAAVVQLVSTAESVLTRRLANWDGQSEIDMSPRDYILDYLTNGWPVTQFAVRSDEDGNLRSEMMVGEDGAPVTNPQAEATRDELTLELAMMPGIDTALDALLKHFGPEMVAEVTGRSKRMVWPKGEAVLESRPGTANIAETNAFMDGKKPILVFSDAGGTGRSYHADLTRKNQARRHHYLLQPGWRADNAIQGLGRSHRTNQASAPIFRPVTTNVRGERRFISTIARRLDTLGALTRGQRQTGGQGLFNPADNLESGPAQESLRQWFHLLVEGKAKSIGIDDFEARTGLFLREKETNVLKDDTPPISRFLNRLLALDIGTQNRIFAEFQGLIDARIEALTKAGKLDLGVETIRASRLTIPDQHLIRKDARTGAETRLLTIDLHYKRKAHSLADMEQLARNGFVEARYVRNSKSGKVGIVADMRETLNWSGALVWTGRLLRPSGSQAITPEELEESNWEDLDRPAFNALWAAEVAEVEASERTQQVHVVTGLLLPVWGMLPGGNCHVWRIEAPDTQPILGRIIEPEDLATLAENFGVGDAVKPTPEMLSKVVAKRGIKARLPVPGQVTLKRVVVNDSHRLEIEGLVFAQIARVKPIGAWAEISQGQARVFMPVDNTVTRITDLILALGGTVESAGDAAPPQPVANRGGLLPALRENLVVF